MHKNLLNIIIVISLIGILVGAVRENIKNKNEQILAPKVISPTIVASDISPTIVKTLVPCKNAYFNFIKGTSWKYEMKTASSSSTFTSTIVESKSSEITLQTTFDKTKASQKTKLTCEEKGITGFPFPILTALSSVGSSNSQLLNMIKLDDQIVFLPNDNQLKLNGTWQTPIKINIPLPIQTGGFDVSLDNKIGIETDQYILQQNLHTLEVNTTFNSGALSGLLQQEKSPTSGEPIDIFSYTLGKGIGIVNFKFTLNLDKTKKTDALEIKLVEFTDGGRTPLRPTTSGLR